MKFKAYEILIVALVLIALAFGFIVIGQRFWDGRVVSERDNIEPSELEFEGWERQVSRIMIDEGVVHVEDCLRWAFGEGFEQLEQRELDDMWRQRHSDLFVIHGHDDIVESTKRIAKAWLDRKPQDV